MPWAQATRAEARDFCRWLALIDKPRRGGVAKQAGGTANPVTGKRSPGGKYAPSTLAHSETVLRAFYAFHLEAGTGPIINPFPLVRERAGGRAHAHHTSSSVQRLDSAPETSAFQIHSSLAPRAKRALSACSSPRGSRASSQIASAS